MCSLAITQCSLSDAIPAVKTLGSLSDINLSVPLCCQVHHKETPWTSTPQRGSSEDGCVTKRRVRLLVD